MAGSNSPSHDVSSSQFVINSNSAPELAFVVNPSSKHTQVRFNCFSRTELLSTIKRELSKADWNCLSKGCLGAIVRMGSNLTSYNQLIYQMLLRQVQTDKKKEMWFRVDGRLMRFSLLEFCCVTGLKCVEDNLDLGPPNHVSVSGFLGLHRCYLKNLIDKFVKTPKNSPKKLVLAKWIIIEGVILPQRHEKEVRDEFLSLACDRERFEHYAWGRESYLQLIDSLKSVCRIDTKSAGPRPGYNVFGYLLAFQIWIFEAIPSIPRFLNCSFTHVESDPSSLEWASDVKIKRVKSDKAGECFATPLATIHSLYAEFMTEHHLQFIDEVADPRVDSFVKEFVDADDREEPPNSARKVRMRFHIIKAGRVNGSTELDPSAATRKEKTRGHPSDDADDFEAPATKKPKHKHKHARGKSTSQKTNTMGRQSPQPDLVSPVELEADEGSYGLHHAIMESLKAVVQLVSSLQQQSPNEDSTLEIVQLVSSLQQQLLGTNPCPHCIKPTREADDSSVGVDPTDKESPSAVEGRGAEPTKVVVADENLAKEASFSRAGQNYQDKPNQDVPILVTNIIGSVYRTNFQKLAK